MEVAELHYIGLMSRRRDAHRLEVMRCGDADRIGVESCKEFADFHCRPGPLLRPIGLKAAEPKRIPGAKHRSRNGSRGFRPRHVFGAAQNFERPSHADAYASANG